MASIRRSLSSICVTYEFAETRKLFFRLFISYCRLILATAMPRIILTKSATVVYARTILLRNFILVSLSFYRTGNHSIHDFFVEYQEKDQHRNCDHNDIRKQQIITVRQLSFVIVQSKLDRCILRTRQEIQRICKIIKRLYADQNNQRCLNRL